MSNAAIETEVRDAAIAALLASHPEAVVAALAPDGFRVSMPTSVGIRAEQALPVPADRATMVDLVVPADGMKVIAIWEQAAGRGMSIGSVRIRNDPDQPIMLTFIDARHRHGVWLGFFTHPDGSTMDDDSAADGSRFLVVPLRPRTATIHKTMHAVITAIDDRTSRMLGWTEQQMLGARTIEFIHPDDHGRALANWMEMLSTQESQRVRLRHRCQDGGWLWVEIENRYQHAEDPGDVVVAAQLSDISDEMASHEALDRREKLFRRLAESLPIGLLQLQLDGSLIYANERLTELLGTHAADTLDGLLATVAGPDRSTLDAALAQALGHASDQDLEIDIRLPSSRQLRRCAVTIAGLTDRDGVPGAIVCMQDITDSARLREELKAKATFDSLTGCHNRASVMSVLDQALALDDRPVGTIFIDLSRFKQVNDTLGHAAGDELLVLVADLLTGLLREDDIVGRFGGDEFLVVCRRLNGLQEALAVAERVREALHRPVTLAAGVVELAAGIGVAVAVAGMPADTLIAQADAAMYESKREGLGRPVLYRVPASSTM